MKILYANIQVFNFIVGCEGHTYMWLLNIISASMSHSTAYNIGADWGGGGGWLASHPPPFAPSLCILAIP